VDITFDRLCESTGIAVDEASQEAPAIDAAADEAIVDYMERSRASFADSNV
jgi:hypothetical protein